MPDLNLSSEQVRSEIERIVDFWLDKRVGAFVKARSESFSVQNSNVTGLKPGQSAVGLGADWQAFSAMGEVLFRGQELSARGLEKWNWTAECGEFQIEGELRHSWKYASGMKNELRASQ